MSFWNFCFFQHGDFFVCLFISNLVDCHSASLRRPNLPSGHLLDLLQDPLLLGLDQSRVHCRGIVSFLDF